jgi:peptide methionine sulfoxide reductase MsrB
MKQKLFTLLLILTASFGMMRAEIYSGTCGDHLTWVLNTEDSTLTMA